MTGFLYSQSVIANCQDYMLLCMSLSLSVDEDNLKASLSLRRFFQLLPTKQLNPGDIFTQKKTFFFLHPSETSFSCTPAQSQYPLPYTPSPNPLIRPGPHVDRSFLISCPASAGHRSVQMTELGNHFSLLRPLKSSFRATS